MAREKKTGQNTFNDMRLLYPKLAGLTSSVEFLSWKHTQSQHIIDSHKALVTKWTQVFLNTCLVAVLCTIISYWSWTVQYSVCAQGLHLLRSPILILLFQPLVTRCSQSGEVTRQMSKLPPLSLYWPHHFQLCLLLKYNINCFCTYEMRLSLYI